MPLGVVPQLVAAGVPGADRLGSPSFGGSIVTGGGLVFIAAGLDDVIRAFDVESGEVLWRAGSQRVGRRRR